MTPSAVLLRKELTIRAGLAVVSQVEEQHGAFTPQELADAGQWAARVPGRASADALGARAAVPSAATTWSSALTKAT